MRSINKRIDLLAKAFKENNVDSIDILYQDGGIKNISIYVALQIILADRNRQIRDIIFNYK